MVVTVQIFFQTKEIMHEQEHIPKYVILNANLIHLSTEHVVLIEMWI